MCAPGLAPSPLARALSLSLSLSRARAHPAALTRHPPPGRPAAQFCSLKCRSTPLEYIRRGKPDAGFPIFESECLKWPGFVEFDDVNAKVLTYSAQDKAYRVWGMTNYELLYTLPDDDVTEIKMSPGIMLLIHARQGGYVPLKIVAIHDGSTLKQFNHLLHRSKKVCHANGRPPHAHAYPPARAPWQLHCTPRPAFGPASAPWPARCGPNACCSAHRWILSSSSTRSCS